MTGRFTQEDVIYNDGLNLYAYCNNNPVMYDDPSGFAKKLTLWQQYQKDNAGRVRDQAYYDEYYELVKSKKVKIYVVEK